MSYIVGTHELETKLMASQSAYSNGIPGIGSASLCEVKVSSDDDQASFTLLERSNAASGKTQRNRSPRKDLNVETNVDNLKNDLRSIDSVSDNDKCSLSVSYKKGDSKSDEDATSTYEGVKFIGLSDADSICSSNPPEDPEEPQIPDGGWGWVVVAASFLIATVADGLAFSYGLMNDELQIQFNATAAETSLIGTLFISVPFIAGPIMSALVDRYGCRKMTIVGATASTIGFIAAAFSNSLEVLYVTFGLMAGLGMGLLYVTAVVCIAYWFDKRRNLALGLGSCGVGFGKNIYAPFTSYLLGEYGWRGTLLILSGTVLIVCVCGAVMRDPKWLILEQKKQRKLSKSKRASTSISIPAKSGGGASVFPGVEELKSLMKSGETPEYILTTLVASIAEAENLGAIIKHNADEMTPQKVYSVINLPTFLRQSEKVPTEVLDQLTSNKRLYNIILENYPSLLALRSNSEQKLPVKPAVEVSKHKPVTMSMKLKLSKKEKKKKDDFESKLNIVREKLLQPIPEHKPAIITPKSIRQDWLTRQFGTDHHYLRDIRVHRNSIMHRGAMTNIAKYKLRASSCPDIYKNSMWSMEDDDVERTWGRKILDAINKTLDFMMMFTEFHFLMMNLSTFILCIWFIVPYFYIANFMEMKGYEEKDGAFIFSVFSTSTIFGIVGLGWAGDLPWVHISKTYSVCLIICGCSIFMFPVILKTTNASDPFSFYLLVANSLAFGLTFSSSYSYTPSILVELVGLDKFAMAYGLVLLSQGLGLLVGPPIAGSLLYNIGMAWDAAFYVAGIWVVVSGVLVIIIPYTKNFRIVGNLPLCKDVAPDPESNVRIIIAH